MAGAANGYRGRVVFPDWPQPQATSDRSAIDRPTSVTLRSAATKDLRLPLEKRMESKRELLAQFLYCRRTAQHAVNERVALLSSIGIAQSKPTFRYLPCVTGVIRSGFGELSNKTRSARAGRRRIPSRCNFLSVICPGLLPLCVTRCAALG